MSHPYIGPLSAYNSLTDKHLTGYFNNTRIRRHLQRAGLITRSGKILTEKEYRINAMRRDHQKYIRECLAQAIFHKVLDMERRHQIDIKQKLEIFARKNRVQRIKQVDLSKRAKEETFPAYSPRPPTGPKSGMRRHFRNREHSDSSETASSPRPNTAPGNMQRPVRLQPLPVYSSSGNVPKLSSGCRKKHMSDDDDHKYHSANEKDRYQTTHTADFTMGVSPYRLPIINNFFMPAPPPPQTQARQNTVSRGRRYRPTTAPNVIEITAKDPAKFHKTSLHSNVKITMVYLGKNVHLSHDDNDYRDEIKVFQQHCGGENLCVYKGRLLEEECFSLVSRRHRGFPFSLTFYINGIQVDRLSSCCEYKHRKGARLGGKNGYFGFINIEGASPCYRCIIAMGLDKKPSPPPPKSKGRNVEDGLDDREEKAEIEDEVQETICYNEPDNKSVQSGSIHGDDEPKEDKSSMDYEEEGEEEEEETEGEKRADSKTDEYEADDEAKDDYDEDFEAEDCKPDEKPNEDRQADDQVAEKSPSDDEKDDIKREARSSPPSKAPPEASDSDADERDSDNEERKQDRKHPGSLSSSSSGDSSSSDQDSNDEDEIADHDEVEDAEKNEKKPEEPEEIYESNELTEEREEEPEEEEPKVEEAAVEESVDETEETVNDEGHPAADDSAEVDASQSELEETKDDIERTISSPEENDREKEAEAIDPMDEDKAEVEDNLDINCEEDGGE